MVIGRVKKFLSITKSKGIARRYFIINSFDGALTALGIIIGASLANADPRLIISAVIGASIAMLISGFTGTYMSERTEKLIELKGIERAVLRKLRKTSLGSAFKTTPFITAAIGGLSPLGAAIFVLIPYLLYLANLFPGKYLLYSSIGLCFFFLFMLGIFLGRIAKEQVFLSGLKTMAVGAATALIIYLIL